MQINGKTRDVISIQKDLDQKDINIFILKQSKAKKYLENNEILKQYLLKIKLLIT